MRGYPLKSYTWIVKLIRFNIQNIFIYLRRNKTFLITGCLFLFFSIYILINIDKNRFFLKELIDYFSGVLLFYPKKLIVKKRLCYLFHVFLYFITYLSIEISSSYILLVHDNSLFGQFLVIEKKMKYLMPTFYFVFLSFLFVLSSTFLAVILFFKKVVFLKISSLFFASILISIYFSTLFLFIVYLSRNRLRMIMMFFAYLFMELVIKKLTYFKIGFLEKVFFSFRDFISLLNSYICHGFLKEISDVTVFLCVLLIMMFLIKMLKIKVID